MCECRIINGFDLCCVDALKRRSGECKLSVGQSG